MYFHIYIPYLFWPCYMLWPSSNTSTTRRRLIQVRITRAANPSDILWENLSVRPWGLEAVLWKKHIVNGHFRNLNWSEYPQKMMALIVVQYLHFRILKFPLILWKQWWKQADNRYNLWLVGGLEPWTFMTFHISWKWNHNPNWRSPSFFWGVGKPPTRWENYEPTTVTSIISFHWLWILDWL